MDLHLETVVMAEPSIYAENFKTDPYWWDAAPPDAEGDAPPPARVDVAIVGSGYTGLSAALELARGGREVAVLEAQRFGEGASTRNGGMLSGGVNVGKGGDVERLYGAERVAAMLEEASESFAHLEALIEREGIDCQFSKPGRFVGAHTPSAYRAQADRLETLNTSANAGAYMVPRDRQGEEIASDYYHGGMVVERAGGAAPRAVSQGLARRLPVGWRETRGAYRGSRGRG